VRNSISLSSAKHLPARKRGGYAERKRGSECMSWHNLICTLAHPFKSASIHSAIHCAHCIKPNVYKKKTAPKRIGKQVGMWAICVYADMYGYINGNRILCFKWSEFARITWIIYSPTNLVFDHNKSTWAERTWSELKTATLV